MRSTMLIDYSSLANDECAKCHVCKKIIKDGELRFQRIHISQCTHWGIVTMIYHPKCLIIDSDYRYHRYPKSEFLLMFENSRISADDRTYIMQLFFPKIPMSAQMHLSYTRDLKQIIERIQQTPYEGWYFRKTIHNDTSLEKFTQSIMNELKNLLKFVIIEHFCKPNSASKDVQGIIRQFWDCNWQIQGTHF